ncbi:unnamed protein product [Adineta steineri]|uniref:Carrier domain-containing protein n=1 Tax=Adineta steineri TaxID=433720 RepID=A0A819UPK8_9BILA|nr:unnamed protein product [Adineta steineri]
MARCSFDNHLLSLIGTLAIGSTLVMLRPEGNMDLEYLSRVLDQKQITVMHAVPSLLNSLFEFLKSSTRTSAVKCLRSLCSGGEAVNVNQVTLFQNLAGDQCRIRNHYGPAEITVNCACYLIDMSKSQTNIPIGQLLPNYQCLILDEFLQFVCNGQKGELLVSGVGIFAGYFRRDDLTAKVMININETMYYKTGDLVRMDTEGFLYYVHRQDYQIKLHGQRIELEEIERCLLNITSISACVVMKWNDDHLVAYVQSSDINEEQLRHHCQSHLSPHMIPSIFIILDKLPLNPNGKIDRKLLPPPSFSSMHLTNHDELLLPMNETEIIIHDIWCEILKQNQISTDANIFSIGGHSLLIMQLFHRYKTQFHLKTNSLSISDLFRHPTIADHAQLIYQTMTVTENITDYHWSSLHIIEAKASFAQERIFLDEQIRFAASDNSNIYAIPLIYRVSSKNDHISVSRLQHAFQSIIKKHQVLRTALHLDANGAIIQHCLDANVIINDKKSSEFSMINLPDDEHEQNNIVKKILNHSDLFDLSIGRVINCHILRRDQSNHSFTQNNDLLTKDDLILFTFHHACFDGASASIFIRDLSLAYQSNELLPIDDKSLQYIDYSIHEHITDMTSSQEFWQLELKGYNLTRQLSLPVDRQRSLANQQRSGLASTAQITFNDEICRSFLNYASSHHLTLFQLGLSIFYVFLFKLSHGETDLCISSINANRYRSELVNMIGMFVSTLPYRVELDPHWSFDEVAKYVQEKCLSILEHSHYPLQHILSDNRLNQSNVSFLETMFDSITISKETNYLSLNDVNLEEVSLQESYEMAKFDFSLNVAHNPSSDENRLSCCFICSRDIFDGKTVVMIAPASFAQCRIWSKNQRDADTNLSSLAAHGIPFFYRLYIGDILSVQKLRYALQFIANKHESLHTSLIYDSNKNLLMQRVLSQPDNNNGMFTITESSYETDEQLNVIIVNEKCNPELFDLAQGLVFRCHIIYYKQISSNSIISDKDIIIFNFHHAFFDYPSMDIFLHDLDQAYKTGQLTTDNDITLRYIDYAIIEQQMSMTGASMFWLDTLYDCKLDQSLSLPYDRHRLINEHRTDRATSISFEFGQDLSHHFLMYASSNNIKHEHLALAIYFLFLFKLTNGDKDLCIAMNIDNRYRDELKSIIGLFENVVPLRCQLDPHWSCQYLLDYVREITTNSMKYSYFPLQHILNQHPNISKPAFLDITFEFLSCMISTDNKLIMIGDSQLSSIPFTTDINDNVITNKYDFSLLIQHDVNLNEFLCTINASLDLFNVETIDKISQRFHSILKQSFTSVNDQMNKTINEISLTLPDERLLMQSMNNTETSFPSSTCIHHTFVGQVMRYPQKLAVELDDQSLTYSELLYYVQLLSLNLLNKYHVSLGDVICQCVERSLSMVIGIMAIEMVGGVYCPLSPRDPQHRLYTLIQQTECRLILAHYQTKTKFNDGISSLIYDPVLVNENREYIVDIDRLSDVLVTSENIAYLVFTSGSTGIPKGVQIRHRNLTACIDSLIYINLFSNKDNMIQMASCSYDVHVQEVIGGLTVGASIIMLHPEGNMDIEYVINVLNKKAISYLQSVPAYVNNMLEYVEKNNSSSLSTLRTLDIGGEKSTVQLIEKIHAYLPSSTFVWNSYGPAETTVNCTCHVIDKCVDIIDIPIGHSLPNYRCLVLDSFLQFIVIDQEGELFVGEMGVFAGYLGRDDLTATALVEIGGQLFYRTGDLVRLDNSGLLHYQGRKDHQIKLRGQRIELGEIEQCLLRTSISTCVVIKWSDDHLVAYVQSSDIDEKVLREHCQSHLPPHMTPSSFVILDKLPLNANGKVDRKLLSPPDFLSIVTDHSSNVPSTTLEQQLQQIFSQVLHTESPPVDVPLSQLGGTSLDAIRVLTLIRQQVYTNIDIGLLFTNPSIRQLAITIEPLLISNQSQVTVSTVDRSH